MKVAIIGGGFCGVLIAKKLEKIKDIQTVLIDNKSYFEYQPSLHKVVFKPEYINKIRRDYTSFLKNTEIIIRSVKKVTSQQIITSKEKINFDILIISTGIDYPIFLENEENVHVLKNGAESLQISKKIRYAKHILIVGGGLIGTEFAGEIVTKLPNKSVTIIHPHNKILERIPHDAAYYTQKFFEKNRVKFIFGEKVISHINGTYFTNNKREIYADLCIWCAGIKCNPYFMKEFPDKCFSEINALKVNNYLQLDGFSNIFIGGDINNIKEEKTARKAELHAKIIVKNIKRMLTSQPLLPYKSGRSPMIISLGDWRGIILYKYVFPGLFIPGILKWLIQWWFMRQLK
ncbi:MAG: NAD(P)/FAD-dependent oxidoreductase [Candidatus Hodarchaeota archaeon]